MKQAYFLCLLFFTAITITAAPVDFLPVSIQQPDGTVIQCYVSGDEFFNFLHDDQGYTIIQGEDGWYYYGEVQKGIVVPTEYIVGVANPSLSKLQQWAKISGEEYKVKYDAMWSQANSLKNGPTAAPHTGTFNNLVIYIRFSDDTEFTTSRQVYDDRFNLSPGSSVKSYFNEVSYGMLDVNSTHYPACAMNVNLSYQDSYPRSYYQPYNATTNPNGYQNENIRAQREHSLLKNAVDWINIHSPVPGSLNIDANNDGYVDNVSFIIRGNAGGWASLLWAHRWVLYTHNVQINGKQIWDYTFQPENQCIVKTLCHELFHTMGAPDLYHYYYDTHIQPAGNWDLMSTGGGHMTTYMKWKYSNETWISNIPEITTPGVYTLNPASSPTNNCYKIASPNSASEYFIVEYRQKAGTFESAIPGSGLIVYRVDPSLNGNAFGPPDELYIYRPNGTLTINGVHIQSHFAACVGRTEINDNTNPSSFLSNGLPGGLDIWNISAAGSTITFHVGPLPSYEIEAVLTPSGAGNISGEGIFIHGDTVTLSATANPGFVFASWTKDAAIVSTNPDYSFIAENDVQLVANFVSYTIACDSISNIEGSPVNNTWLGNGYASGHNGAGWTEFAEKFTNVIHPQVDGLRIYVAKAVDNCTPSPVTFKVYEYGNSPGNVIASKTVNMGSLTENAWNDILFDTPVTTSGNYFIGYEISYAEPHHTDTFAVFMSNSAETTYNTAYAFTQDGWKPYNILNSNVSFGSHFWIESMNCYQFFEVVIENDDPDKGYVSGEGFYGHSSPVKVNAIAYPGYAFVNWTHDGVVISTDNMYEFLITEDMVLKANFELVTAQSEFNLNAVKTYPNPVTDVIYVEGAPGGTHLAITDLQGRTLFNTILSSQKETINMETYRPGIYLIHFSNEGDNYTGKIMKQ
jgi:M6 family metalloprotease-like protein